MKRNLLILAIILLIGLIVNSCGGDDEQPKPTQQTYPIDLGNGKKVNVNYMAVTGSATPSYMSDLVAAIEIIASGMPTATYTINVIDGNSGFAKTGSKTLSVGKSWFSGKGVQQILEGIVPLMIDWVAMIQPTHDNSWKQLKGYFVKIENVNANLLNVV